MRSIEGQPIIPSERERRAAERSPEVQFRSFAQAEFSELTRATEQVGGKEQTRRQLLSFAFKAATGMYLSWNRAGLLEASPQRAETKAPGLEAKKKVEISPQVKEAVEKLRKEFASPEFQGTRKRFEELFGNITGFHQYLLDAADQHLEDVSDFEKDLPSKSRWSARIPKRTIEEKYAFLGRLYQRFFDERWLEKQVPAQDKKPEFIKFPQDKLPGDSRTIVEFLQASINPQILSRADAVACVPPEKELTKSRQKGAVKVAVAWNVRGLEKILNDNFRATIILFTSVDQLRTPEQRQNFINNTNHELAHLFDAESARNLCLMDRMRFDLENAEILADPARPKSWYVDDFLLKELAIDLKRDRKLIRDIPQLKSRIEKANHLSRSRELWAELNEWYESSDPAIFGKLTPRMRDHVEKWRGRMHVPIKSGG